MNAKLKTRTLRARRNTMARTIAIHGQAHTARRLHLYLKTARSSTERRVDDNDGYLIFFKHRTGCHIVSTAQDGGH